jgi:hypothetical protein
MAGLVPAIHVFGAGLVQDADAWVKRAFAPLADA